MNLKDISEGFVKQIIEEKLSSMGLLKDHEEVFVNGEFSVGIKKKEEVYSIITHGEESFTK